MTVSAKFEQHLSIVHKVVRSLSSHSNAYDLALSQGDISTPLAHEVGQAVAALWAAYDDLSDGVALCCLLPVGATRARLPFLAAQADPENPFLSDAKLRASGLGARIANIVAVSNSDGWLTRLASIGPEPEHMNLRRGVGRVDVSVDADGKLLMSFSTETGESLPVLAPVRLAADEAGTQRAYYLAILPQAVELVSFLDRCAGGIEQLRASLRAELKRSEL